MSIVGIFSQSEPSINGYAFDAVLKERTELETEVTKYPIENGAVGNDHAVQRPLRLTMRVGISDNAFRRILEEEPGEGGQASFERIGSGVAVGGVVGALSGAQSAVAGVGGTIANAAYEAGQAKSRSQAALEFIRDIQRRALRIEVVATKTRYSDVLITSTRQETTRENEGGLELVIEMTKLLLVSDSPRKGVPAQNDPAATQAQETTDIGRLVPQ